MSIQEVQNKIIELLGEIEGLKGVYSYPEISGKDGYPYIFVIWESNDSEILTNANDRVKMSFKVVLVQEKLSSFRGPAAAEAVSNDRVWKIEKIFRDNNDLEIAGVLRVLPVSSKKTYDNSEPRIIVESVVEVEAIASVTT